jgi:hypothetical protein
MAVDLAFDAPKAESRMRSFNSLLGAQLVSVDDPKAVANEP